MYILIIFISILYFEQALAQGRVFIKPIIENSSYISKGNNKSITTPDFAFKTKPLTIHNGVDIGITIGYGFKKSKFSIETGVQQSMAGSGLAYTYYRYMDFSKANSYYELSRSNYSLASSGLKIPIRFSARLLKKQIHFYKATPLYFSCNVDAGINLYHQYTDTSALSGYNDSITISPDKQLLVNISSHTLNRAYSLLIEGGINFEFGRNEKEWITINVYYLRGFSNLIVNKGQFTVINKKDNYKYSYTTHVYGQGSACIIALSKKIFLKKKKKILP